mmetsp:Transcript_8223/g.16251  ORF Transcript_8223/g.16251 Transcript_8223/m.16251 type:complete len:219 (+) Transcript_8223:563-1219(+)
MRACPLWASNVAGSRQGAGARVSKYEAQDARVVSARIGALRSAAVGLLGLGGRQNVEHLREERVILVAAEPDVALVLGQRALGEHVHRQHLKVVLSSPLKGLQRDEASVLEAVDLEDHLHPLRWELEVARARAPLAPSQRLFVRLDHVALESTRPPQPTERLCNLVVLAQLLERHGVHVVHVGGYIPAPEMEATEGSKRHQDAKGKPGGKNLVWWDVD